jgi:hypothetical protein
VTPDRAADSDALLLLDLVGGDRAAVAVPVGPETADPRPVRATYALTVDGTAPADADVLRAAGPVLSLMSGDARYPLVRDRAARPAGLDVGRTPAAVTLAVVDPHAAVLPSFVLSLAPPLPPIPQLPTG